MSKRKSVVVEHGERGSGKENLSPERGSEDEANAGDDLSGSGEERLDEQHESSEESSSGDEYTFGEDDVRSGGEEEHAQNAESSTAFGRAFGKIMKKRVSESGFTEISGPVLAERKQLLVQKFEEAENEGKAKISGREEKLEVRERGHTLPQTYADAREKALIKLATKGVVRLFNAVSKAQKVQADADVSSRTSAKATSKQSKEAFMSEFRSSSKSWLKGAHADEVPGQNQGQEEEHGWAALRTDFMLGTSKKLINWDKNISDSGPVNDT